MTKYSQNSGKNGRKGYPQANMHDVAHRAGVSLMTVSRALYDPQKVSEKTRNLVEKAIIELGYVPNLVAGGLARSQSKIVSMIVPFVTHGVFAEAIQGVSDVVEESGYKVLLGNSGGSREREESILRSVLGYRPAGIVIQGANHNSQTVVFLRKAKAPVVEIGTLPDDPIDMAVGYSNFDAAYEMTQYLISAGYRRIGFVGVNPENNDRIARRLSGYKAALMDNGRSVDVQLIVESDFGIEQGRKVLHAFLRLPEMPDAIFCASDLWAAGMISECHALGIDVPSQLAISGFNDQDIATTIRPAITTIRVPRYEIGRMAGELIVNGIAQKHVEPIVNVGFELIVRDST